MSIHSCSFYCNRPECVKRQRDDLVVRFLEKDMEKEKKRSVVFQQRVLTVLEEYCRLYSGDTCNAENPCSSCLAADELRIELGEKK